MANNPPQRVLALAAAVDREIAALPGVAKTDEGSFRVGGKVFIRLDRDRASVVYGSKLGRAAAREAATRYEFLRPMNFGGMGAKGWVELRLRRKDQTPTLLRKSREFYPAWRR